MDEQLMTEYLTARELAERWKIHHRTLSNWRLTDRGPNFLKFGSRNIRYTLEAVEAYESSHFESVTVSSV
jgi:hypothetical protein